MNIRMNSAKKLLKSLILLIVFLCSSKMVSQSCSASFTATIGPNYVVTFSNTSSYTGSLTSVFWSFQGGTPVNSTSLAPTETYTAPGTYNVIFVIFTSGPSCTHTLSGSITI